MEGLQEDCPLVSQKERIINNSIIYCGRFHDLWMLVRIYVYLSLRALIFSIVMKTIQNLCSAGGWCVCVCVCVYVCVCVCVSVCMYVSVYIA